MEGESVKRRRKSIRISVKRDAKIIKGRLNKMKVKNKRLLDTMNAMSKENLSRLRSDIDISTLTQPNLTKSESRVGAVEIIDLTGNNCETACLFVIKYQSVVIPPAVYHNGIVGTEIDTANLPLQFSKPSFEESHFIRKKRR